MPPPTSPPPASNAAEPFVLQRFVDAQDRVWADVEAELRAGDKRTHWMWFVFPQLAVLGRSDTARHFGISGLDEARAYAAHPVLGARLRSACDLLLQTPPGRSSQAILGPPDHLKLRSAMTLFAAAAPQETRFAAVLARFDDGIADPLTLAALASRP